MFGERCLRLSVFGVVLSAHARRLPGLSLDLAVKGERALDAVALHHLFGVAGVARERGCLGSYPHTPTQPQVQQKAQPSLLIRAKVAHSLHFNPFIFGAAWAE